MTSDGSNAHYQDPGWLPALKGLHGRRKRVDGVVVLRMVFLSLTVAGILILYVLTFIMDDLGSPSPPLLVAIVALGAAAAFAARRISRTRLDATSTEKAVATYRTRFFLAFAINEMPLLLSFVLCFVEDAMWPYLVELPIFLVGMAGIAPGRRNLDAIEHDLMQRGAQFSLRAELAKAELSTSEH